jgi:hypothetical protein
MSARELMQSRKHHQLWLSGLRQFASVGLMFRFSGGALNFVPWHFIHHHRPLQPFVRPSNAFITASQHAICSFSVSDR